jgi:hypothetical protein
LVKEIVRCINNHKVVLNSLKHQNREKYCPKCRAIVANPHYSLMDLLKSAFQGLKRQRKNDTRTRFIERMKEQGMDNHDIAIRLEKRFPSEVA